MAMTANLLGTYRPCTQDASKLVQSIRLRASDPSLMDDEEALPGSATVEAATDFVSELFALLEVPPPTARVGTFFGEVNVVWQAGTRSVRLAFFPDRPILLVFGDVSQPSGSYRGDANPSPSEVAARLMALT